MLLMSNSANFVFVCSSYSYPKNQINYFVILWHCLQYMYNVQHNVSESSKRDILTMLTTACDAEGTHLSKRELVDHVFGFLLAGFDVGHLLPSCVYPLEASIIVKI